MSLPGVPVRRDGPMNRWLTIALAAWLQAAVPASAAPADGTPEREAGHAALKGLAAPLGALLKATCPVAQVTLDGGGLTVRYRTQTFLVHGSSKGGEYDTAAHAEEGPNRGGFLLRLTFHAERPVRAAVVPQDLQGPYWRTFIDDYPLGAGAGGGYVSMSLSYGRHAPNCLLSEIKACVAEAARGGKQ
jgi:hypothetical protein